MDERGPQPRHGRADRAGARPRAGPGTAERHERYLRLVEPLPVPDLCVYHAVEPAISEEGAVSGRVLQAFARPGEARLVFG